MLIQRAVKLMGLMMLGVAMGSSAGEVTLYYSDGSAYDGDLRLDDNGEYELAADGKLYAIDMDSVMRCEGAGCPSAAERKQQKAKVKKTKKTQFGMGDLGKKNKGTIGVYGSNTIGAELMPRLITEYANQIKTQINTTTGAKSEESILLAKDRQGNTTFSIDLRAHGSGTSFPGLASGAAEIGMASRPIKNKESIKLRKSGIKDLRGAGKEHVLALDGLIVVVSQSNPIHTLSMKQIAQLFSGKITNWSQVGGDDRPVNVYARDNKSGTFDTFKSLVLKPNKAKLAAKAKRFESNEELSDAVASDKGGIGFTGFAYLRNAKALSLSTACGIVSEPTIFNVKTEEYPLGRRLYLYTTGKQLPKHAKGILDYALSDDAQSVIEDIGFIDQSITTKSFRDQGERLIDTVLSAEGGLKPLKEMLSILKDAQRISTTFRFKTGSSDLDVKSVRDLSRIAKQLSDKKSEFYGREIYLIGFSDSIGAFNSNLNLSVVRAKKVASEIGKLLPKDIRKKVRVKGYGELSPIACNTNKAGQAKNRRVELWVR